jgi:hypothetical protein
VSPVGHQVVSELDFTGAGVDERSLVVVDMQGDHDEEAVNQALRAGSTYIGLVRSGRGRSLCSSIGESRIAQQGLGLGEDAGGS